MEFSNRTKLIGVLSAGLLTVAVVSCERGDRTTTEPAARAALDRGRGSGHDGLDDGARRKHDHGQDAAEAEYEADLTPLNARVAGKAVTARARITVEGDRFRVTVEARGLAPRIVHMQHIHGHPDGSDASCPTPQLDTNGDGIVDFAEGLPAYGPVLVPLDNDLALLSAQTYPTASARGRYDYKASASASGIASALAVNFPGAALDLDRRVIVIHGVDPSITLPATVSPAGAQNTTLPVACGVLRRVR